VAASTNKYYHKDFVIATILSTATAQLFAIGQRNATIRSVSREAAKTVAETVKTIAMKIFFMMIFV
jgi:hypothetical protein